MFYALSYCSVCRLRSRRRAHHQRIPHYSFQRGEGFLITVLNQVREGTRSTRPVQMAGPAGDSIVPFCGFSLMSTPPMCDPTVQYCRVLRSYPLWYTRSRSPVLLHVCSHLWGCTAVLMRLWHACASYTWCYTPCSMHLVSHSCGTRALHALVSHSCGTPVLMHLRSFT